MSWMRPRSQVPRTCECLWWEWIVPEMPKAVIRILRGAPYPGYPDESWLQWGRFDLQKCRSPVTREQRLVWCSCKCRVPTATGSWKRQEQFSPQPPEGAWPGPHPGPRWLPLRLWRSMFLWLCYLVGGNGYSRKQTQWVLQKVNMSLLGLQTTMIKKNVMGRRQLNIHSTGHVHKNSLWPWC